MILSIEGSDEFVASSAASIATGQATLPRRDFHPLEYTRIHGAKACLSKPCLAPHTVPESRKQTDEPLQKHPVPLSPPEPKSSARAYFGRSDSVTF